MAKVGPGAGALIASFEVALMCLPAEPGKSTASRRAWGDDAAYSVEAFADGPTAPVAKRPYAIGAAARQPECVLVSREDGL